MESECILRARVRRERPYTQPFIIATPRPPPDLENSEWRRHLSLFSLETGDYLRESTCRGFFFFVCASQAILVDSEVLWGGAGRFSFLAFCSFLWGAAFVTFHPSPLSAPRRLKNKPAACLRSPHIIDQKMLFFSRISNFPPDDISIKGGPPSTLIYVKYQVAFLTRPFY